MTMQTMICGLMLVVLGAVGYLNADLNDKGEKPITALIPAVVGALLVFCGYLAMAAPKSRKHVMHLAALLGVLGFLGGFMPLYRQTMVNNLPLDVTAPAVRYGLLMSAICLLFVGLCVMSFIAARKARQASGGC